MFDLGKGRRRLNATILADLGVSDLLSVSEAQERILATISSIGMEQVAIEDGIGRVLGESVYAGIDLPPFSNSSMDGFALRSEDVVDASKDEPVSLVVVGDIPSGILPKIQIK